MRVAVLASAAGLLGVERPLDRAGAIGKELPKHTAEQQGCCGFNPPCHILKATVCQGKGSCFIPQPQATRALVLPDRVHRASPTDSIGVSTVGALWLWGSGYLGTTLHPGRMMTMYPGGMGTWK